VTNFVSNLRPEEVPALVEYVKKLPATTELVLVEHETLPRNHALLKAAAEIEAEVVNYGELDRSELRPWIQQRVKLYNVSIEPGAVELLARLVGPNLRLLSNEIEKLTLYVGGARSIQAADVELLVPYSEESEDFGFANAIAQRNARRAYDQLGRLLDEGKHPMSILASIAGQIRGLLEVKDMAERGMSPLEIARVKGWRSDYPAKMRLREASNFSLARLEQVLELLLETDLQIKTGRIDSLLALDSLVARLCGFKSA
jgi:DNA polymerase-3 subunit delta